MDNAVLKAPHSVQEASHAELIHRFSSDDVLIRLVRQAVREAVLEHKRNGNPVAGSVDGKVVIFQPEDIEVGKSRIVEKSEICLITC